MDIIEKINVSKAQMEDILNTTNSWDSKRVEHLNKLLYQLKEFVLETAFKDSEEEINFFKVVKPVFSGQLQHALQMQRILLDSPNWSASVRETYLHAQIEEIKHYFEIHREITSYYRSGDSNLDFLLFLRGRDSCPAWLCVPKVDMDERFSTLGDPYFAEIMAYEWTAQALNNLIEGQQSSSSNEIVKSDLKWTGDTINLTELAYGIQCSGQVNGGNAGIAEIVRGLEFLFNIKVGRPYRRFSEIRQRKRLSRTQFLDNMGKALNQKLEDEEAYRP
ncbi:MAG: RteC domain-containing protein [Sphingobacterium sp.]|jgi:hypothetical protein|nr:RteC domain-containing protein [Sphingobacterium sp.]